MCFCLDMEIEIWFKIKLYLSVCLIGAYFARDALYSHRYSAQAQRAPRHAAQPLNTSVLNHIARSMYDI